MAVLVLIAGVVSDVLARHFWSRNSVLADLVSGLIVVMLTVAVVNEVIERRQQRRWSVVAQYVMFALVRNARQIWTGVMELAGLMALDGDGADSIDAAAAAVRDTPRLTAAVREAIADQERRQQLHEAITEFVIHGDELLGRWAAVMLGAGAYAEIVDRHVELHSDVAWLGSLLDHAAPEAEGPPRRRIATSPAVQIEGELDDERLADRIVRVSQLAEGLDRATLELALRIVPIDWWAARLGTTPPAIRGRSEPADASALGRGAVSAAPARAEPGSGSAPDARFSP